MKRQSRKTITGLKKEIYRLHSRIRYLERREKAHAHLRKIGRGMRELANNMRIVGKEHNMVGFPFCFNIEGGPLWFHYKCRCAAEATIILHRIQNEWCRIYRRLLAYDREIL